ncbi:hypothetical protein [Jatrophihabitans fulvus]
MAMVLVATVVALVLALAVVVDAAWCYRRDEAADTREVVIAGLLELAVLAYVAVRVVDLAGGHRTSSLALAISYLIGLVLIMPAAVLVGLFERSRWGPVIIAVGAVVVAVLFARVDQLWTPGG